DAAPLATPAEGSVDAGAAVAAPGLGVDLLDLAGQGVPALLPCGRRAAQPGVVAGGGGLERLAHQADGPLILVGFDEAEGHVGLLAKNAAAFFRISRSARRRLFSARRRRSSSSWGLRRPLPGKASGPFSWWAAIQERRRVSPMSRERHASATE